MYVPSVTTDSQRLPIFTNETWRALREAKLKVLREGLCGSGRDTLWLRLRLFGLKTVSHLDEGIFWA